MNTVDLELVKRIRLHIERTEKQAELLAERKKWLQLTSALDVIEDTSWAIEYYIKSDYPDDFKGKYLYTYGLLQALFVQADAINSISVALFDEKINFKTDYPQAYAVREMRNDVVGHPTCRDNTNFIYLAQCSLCKDSFYYSKDNSATERNEIINVEIMSAINDQANCINTILNSAVQKLDTEFRKYIEEHRNRKMVEIFASLPYAREKTPDQNPLGAGLYDATKNVVKKCEEELVLRYGSVDAVDSYKYLLDEIHEIYNLIDDLHQIPDSSQLGFKKYMLQILFVKLEELESYCAETDEYFENYGETSISQNEKTTVPVFFGEDELDD